MLGLANKRYRTAQDVRVVPYNGIAGVLGNTIAPTPEFGKSGYGFAVCNNGQKTEAGVSKRVSEIDKDTALLLLTLQRQGYLPDYMQAAFDPEARNGVLRLLYSGLLEMEVDQHFVTGSQALVHVNIELSSAEENTIQNISHTALQRADRLGLNYEDQLFSYLYQYYVIPATPERRCQCRDDKQFLCINEISKNWRYSDGLQGWHYFSQANAASRGYLAKLYISPMPNDLPETLEITARTLKKFAGVSFKVGSGCAGILRPDKLVAYFDSLEILMDAATQLKANLQGIEAHGVPFTSRFSADGLISWGIDPKQTNGERKSWRQWIVEKLVSYMLLDETADIDPSRWKLALAQLELEGINPNTFRPGGAWIAEYS